MKKLIALLLTGIMLLTLQTCVFAKGNHMVYLGIDTLGEVEMKILGYKETSDIDTAFSIGYEYLFDSKQDIKFGIGGEVQAPREFKDYDYSFRFLPVYGLVNIPVSGTKAHLVGKLGYNFISSDDTYSGAQIDLNGGIYYALGAGFAPNDDIEFQALYSVNTASGDASIGGYSADGDATYRKLSILIGKRF